MTVVPLENKADVKSLFPLSLLKYVLLISHSKCQAQSNSVSQQRARIEDPRLLKKKKRLEQCEARRVMREMG